MIDSHAHLADAAFAGDLDAVLARAAAAGITDVVIPATDAANAAAAVALAAAPRADVRLHACAGVHPHEAARWDAAAEGAIEALGRAGRIVAVGEIGLDFHYAEPLPDVQRLAFRAQVRLARRLGLPVVVHCREAEAEVLETLAAEGPTRPGADGRPWGVLHCWTGSASYAARGLELGLCLSVGGIAAFPKAAAVRAVAASVPADRLLVETDAPYLAPPPHRGERCEPAFLLETVRVLAAARGVASGVLAESSSAAARALFGLAA